MEDIKFRFKDEWLLKAVNNIPAVLPDNIEFFRRSQKPYLAEALVQSRIATPQIIGQAVRDTFNIGFVDISSKDVEKMALSLVPEKVCRRHQLIPFRLEDESIQIAMVNPFDLDAQGDVEVLSSRRPVSYYCLPHYADALLAELFNPELAVMGLIDRFIESESVEVVKAESLEAKEVALDNIMSPVIKLVDSIIVKAVRMRASDIHIEHEETESFVRCRVDGALKVIMSIPKQIAAGPVVSRLKIMAELDLAEHFRPQDGRAKLLVGGTPIGLRVSTLPTSFGEKVVLRILDPKTAEVPFKELGFSPEIITRFNSILKAEQGMVLVTGPTGSGKTTTLYSILNNIRSEDSNIVTVEDPIEYKLEGINQVQVNEKQGLTFAGVLRSVLRQDPDVILVGEVRDQETADIAFQAALTGHLVFSTLHTNDTLSTLSRLNDMKVEKFKMATGLIAITAQRLIRRLCPFCKKIVSEDKMDPAVVSILKAQQLPVSYFKNMGCVKCDFNGYKGRLSILELLEIDQEVKDKIKEDFPESELRQLVMNKRCLHTLSADALWHLSQGDTTMEEIAPYLKFELPPNASLAKGEHGRKSLFAKSGTRRIVIADDDPDQRIIVGAYLTKQGYQVEEAVDGADALEKIAQSPPDLLLVDLMMPNIDGYGVIKKTRQSLGLLNLPIIVLTAIGDDRSQEETINLGADDYIVKPLKPALVVARVNALFRRLGK